MPAKSKAQARWAFANQNKGGKLGKAAQEFVPHGPGTMKRLPEKVGKDQQKHINDVMNSVKL